MSNQKLQIQQKESFNKANSAKKVVEVEKPYQPKCPNQLCFSFTGNAPSPVIPPNPLNILNLQQTIGNQAVGRLIQARLKIGQPGDKYEEEADRVADAVMRMPDPDMRMKPT